jgi:hypothetical protein
MQYASPSARYTANFDFDFGFGHSSDECDKVRRTDYSRKSFKALRKRARRKSPQHNPGPGIGGRRNRRIVL